MSIKDDFLRKKTGWWTAARGSTRRPFSFVVYMSKELMNLIEMGCGRRLDCVQIWACKEEGLMFSERCHSQVDRTRVRRKGVLSLKMLLLFCEFNVQDVKKPDKINSEI